MDIWQSFINLLAQALITLDGFVGSYGLAIIVFTILVRLLFLPLSIKSTKSMREMQLNQAKLKPQLDALKKKYGNDRQRLLEEQSKLYKEMGINPMAGLGGCLPLLIQMPIWIGLYSALIGLASHGALNGGFLWIANLGTQEGFPYLLTAFTGISQYAISRMTATPAMDDQQKTMNTVMQFMMPAMMVYFSTMVPAGLVLYWATNNVFQFFQQLFTTGWGELKFWGPKETREVKTEAASAVAAKGAAKKEAAGEPHHAERTERAQPAASGNGRYTGPSLLPDSAAEVKDGLRIYTLAPEADGADYAAEGTSQSMEEAIARAKGQARPKKRKRRS